MSRWPAWAWVVVLAAAVPAAGQQGVPLPLPEDRAAFERVHERLAEDLENSAFGVPLVVEASVDDEVVQGDVYSVLDHPFSRVRDSLVAPEAWCRMLTLHFNVKSCARDGAVSTGAGVRLRIATARKYYVPPQARTPKTYRLDASHSRPDLLRVALTADRGPFGVRGMRIAVFAMDAGEGRSFVHLRYRYAPGWLARAATRAFFGTVGRRKIGFTVVGSDDDGSPVYVRGPRGGVERNAMRYHLAIVAYLDTLDVAEADRFEARIARWFELTERHPEQLHEMSREDYLGMKRREREDQVASSRAGPVPASRRR